MNESGTRSANGVGISAFASYVPAYEVDLADWCEWRGDSWEKVNQVVGTSFRMRSHDENAYTMAATAVLRLIDRHQLDPARIGFLALGTESSTDNSAGAIIVKGMVNDALKARGSAPIARSCEVPEFKHACLGGIYALKAAARYLALDGADRLAVVVSSDVAEYEKNTSGEVTQGAGAVAMLVEANARIATIDLGRAGSASDYRGVDFRKPFLRFMQQQPTALAQPRDFPVFNGKYSTTCYVDEVLAALRETFQRIDGNPADFLRAQGAVFLHRPYLRMAETGLAVSYLLALALGNETDYDELAGYAAEAEVDVEALVQELSTEQELNHPERIADDSYPLATRAARSLRGHRVFQALLTPLGTQAVGQVGNLYTASLPLWLAAGLEQAAAEGRELSGKSLLTIGYGSGDAAEVIPLTLVSGWEKAAAQSGVTEALADAVTLNHENYERLHNGQPVVALASPSVQRFVIDRVGQRNGAADDHGIEYYRLASC
ncbi:MAG: hydroxymethylglutaryl-CoA synthase [Pseudomonadota bacterium]